MFLPRPHREYSGKCWHDGSMMKWGEIPSRERQNPTVSYEWFLSDLAGPTQSSRARFPDTCTRCWAHVLFKKRVYLSQWMPLILLWLMLPICRRYIPCLNTLLIAWGAYVFQIRPIFQIKHVSFIIGFIVSLLLWNLRPLDFKYLKSL